MNDSRAQHRLRLGLVVGAGVAMLALAVVLVVDVAAEPSHPDAWDARVEPIAAWVADERDLEFDHPVEVEFLGASEYRQAAVGDDELDAADEEDMAAAVATMRALGLVSGDVDLEQAGDDLAGAGTLAFYDPDSKRIVVRGTSLTPALRGTLAHELTHVLQDQHFDLNALQDGDDEEAAAALGVIEGDADRIEATYVDSLSSADQAAYARESERAADDAEDELDDSVPAVLQTLFGAPYDLGGELVFVLDAQGGNDAVDDAFREPPTSSEQLFDPRRYLADDEAQHVELDAPDGTSTLDDGQIGSVLWYLMLRRRMDDRTALTAVDGWGGDRYVVYREPDGEKRVCIDVAYVGDSERDVSELRDALDDWIAAGPASDATVTSTDSRLRLHSCDPGKSAAPADPEGDAEEDELALPIVRSDIYAGALEDGASEEQASCFADAVVERFTTEQLTDPDAAFAQTDEGQALVEEAAGSC